MQIEGISTPSFPRSMPRTPIRAGIHPPSSPTATHQTILKIPPHPVNPDSDNNHPSTHQTILKIPPIPQVLILTPLDTSHQLHAIILPRTHVHTTSKESNRPHAPLTTTHYHEHVPRTPSQFDESQRQPQCRFQRHFGPEQCHSIPGPPKLARVTSSFETAPLVPFQNKKLFLQNTP